MNIRTQDMEALAAQVGAKDKAAFAGAQCYAASPVALMLRETKWYQHHGRHQDRIVTDSNGTTYPVGDWSWNRAHPDRREYIEAEMREAGIYAA